MATKHFLYGVPGVGKSTIARQLASKYNYLYIELDNIRSKAQKRALIDEEPFIYEYSTEAWKKFGELNQDTAVKGFLAVRAAFQKYISEELNQHGPGYIAEVVYIDPNIMVEDEDTITMLVVTKDEKFHYSHFFLHRDHSQEEDNQFKAARYIQDYLVEEANKLGINILENSTEDVSITINNNL